MYFARIRFDILNRTYINFDTHKHLLFSRDGYACTLVGREQQISNSNELWLEYGGFTTYDEAFEKSILLIEELKMYCIERKISIKISGEVGETDSVRVSTPTGGITERGKEAFGFPPNSQYEVLGLGIYEVQKTLGGVYARFMI